MFYHIPTTISDSYVLFFMFYVLWDSYVLCFMFYHIHRWSYLLKLFNLKKKYLQFTIPIQNYLFLQWKLVVWMYPLTCKTIEYVLLDSKSDILSNRSKSDDWVWAKLQSSRAQNTRTVVENPWKLVAIPRIQISVFFN